MELPNTLVPHLNTVYDLVRTRNVCSVVAPTGTGKSTILPVSIAMSGTKVMVSTPTRSSAVRLYNTAKEFVNNPAFIIGYAAGGEITYGSESNLVYATAGHVRRLMLDHFVKGKAVAWTGPPVLFLDEIHSGSLDNSIIMALWRKAVMTDKVPFPRLVLITATPVENELNMNFPTHTVSTQQMSVMIEWTKDYDINRTAILYNDIANRAADIHRTADPSDHMLIFLPGESEIKKVSQLLTDKRLQGAIILQAYGTMTSEELSKIHEIPKPNYRKIIVATNVAESSITIKDLGFVLDSMLEKRPGTSSNGGLSLETQFISKKSADQRKGRTGRTRSGKCIRFISESSYYNLDDDRPLEIQSIPLYEEIMQIHAKGINPTDILNVVDKYKIQRTENVLINCGLLRDTPEGIIVTDVGRFASQMKMGVRLSAFLWSWISQGYNIMTGIVVAAVINAEPETFYLPPNTNAPRHTAEYRKAVWDHHRTHYPGNYTGRNHLMSGLAVFYSLAGYGGGVLLAGNSTQEGQNKLREWCRQNQFRYKSISELVTTILTTFNKLNSLKTKENAEVFVPRLLDANVTYGYALPLLHRFYGDMIMNNTGNGRLMDSNGNMYDIDNTGIPSSDDGSSGQYLVLLTIESTKGNTVTRTVKMALPLTEMRT